MSYRRHRHKPVKGNPTIISPASSLETTVEKLFPSPLPVASNISETVAAMPRIPSFVIRFEDDNSMYIVPIDVFNSLSNEYHTDASELYGRTGRYSVEELNAVQHLRCGISIIPLCPHYSVLSKNEMRKLLEGESIITNGGECQYTGNTKGVSMAVPYTDRKSGPREDGKYREFYALNYCNLNEIMAVYLREQGLLESYKSTHSFPTFQPISAFVAGTAKVEDYLIK